jgi:ferric-dicitrate binding protein FerR (iron transport regulator)
MVDDRAFRAVSCERAAEWASLELDGELSELERVLLAAHEARCSVCAAAIAQTRALTTVLRAAPLAEQAGPLIKPVERPRRQAALAVRFAAAAVVAALAAGLGVLVGSVDGGDRRAPAPGKSDIALLPARADFHDRRGVRSPAERLPDERGSSRVRVGGV